MPPDSEASYWGEHPISHEVCSPYSHSMNKRNFSLKANNVRFTLGAVALVTLAGCVGYVEEPRGRVYVAPPAIETTVVVQDDYVYYPGFETYYSSSRHHYLYQERGAWVSRPAPRRVSTERFFASPSVRVDFHDSPAQHHAAMVQQYPRNWKPSGPNQNHHDNPHDEHGGNSRR